MSEQVVKAKAYLKDKLTKQPDLALVLGSGLGAVVESLDIHFTLPYKDIPSFPESNVLGHKGQLVVGSLGKRELLVFQGRFHAYEGHEMEQVVFPVSLSQALGIKELILTNSAGCLDLSYDLGSLMLITDHLSFFLERSPLWGPNDENRGPRFPDMSAVYSREKRQLFQQLAQDLELDLKEGIYAYMPGPQYETPAEIRALASLGATAVGMSTVPEAIVASHGQMTVTAISTLTNYGAGLREKKLEHEAVLDLGEKASQNLASLLAAYCALGF